MKLIHQLYILFLFCMIGLQSGISQEGYQITAQLENFEEKEAYLAYYYGEKPYIKDTVTISQKGLVVFEGKEPLKGGIYLIVLPPNNQFVQIFISEGEQHFKFLQMQMI